MGAAYEESRALVAVGSVQKEIAAFTDPAKLKPNFPRDLESSALDEYGSHRIDAADHAAAQVTTPGPLFLRNQFALSVT